MKMNVHDEKFADLHERFAGLHEEKVRPWLYRITHDLHDKGSIASYHFKSPFPLLMMTRTKDSCGNVTTSS